MSVRCSGGPIWRALQSAVPALAAAGLAAWGLGHAGRPAGWALVVLVPAFGLAWMLGRAAPVTLSWDGQRWTADGVPGTLQVMVDIGGGMLLRLRPEAAPRRALWLALGAAEAGAAFHALRAAAWAEPPAAPEAAARGRR